MSDLHEDDRLAKKVCREAFIKEGLDEGQQWYFWCLKGQSRNPYSHEPDGWEWPPRLSGRIAAKDKEDVRQKLAAEFGETYPMRVLQKERAKHPFLLYVEPMLIGKPGERFIDRFIPRACAVCERVFVLNDHYNDPNKHTASDTCSAECQQDYRRQKELKAFNDGLGSRAHTPVIYCITHKPSGKRYIGKTDQAFTLRWYQHMYHPGKTLFHQLIRTSALSDWQFEVLEQVELSDDELRQSGWEGYHLRVLQREKFWITHFDTIKNGLNSVMSYRDPGESPPGPAL